MNRAMRFSSAAMGMVLLAGLAYYQGSVVPTLGEEDELVGTALVESADINATKELAMDEVLESGCESAAGMDDSGAGDCTKRERSSGTE
jgi:hypothetical protein